MQEIDLRTSDVIEAPNWPKGCTFTLDHGQLLGFHISTYHNGVWCKSVLMVDGKPMLKWQVIKVLNDQLRISNGDENIVLVYQYFPSITVKIMKDDKQVGLMVYPEQTKKLYIIGMWLNGIILVMIAIAIYGAFCL